MPVQRPVIRPLMERRGVVPAWVANILVYPLANILVYDSLGPCVPACVTATQHEIAFALPRARAA
eukprot:5670448-Prymnesium_polylepis.1